MLVLLRGDDEAAGRAGDGLVREACRGFPLVIHIIFIIWLLGLNNKSDLTLWLFCNRASDGNTLLVELRP